MTRHSSGKVDQIVQELDATDLAVYRAIAASPTPALDRSLRRLSNAADRSMLWAVIATGLAVFPGRSRRAAGMGLASIAVASATANIAVKRLVPRARPDRREAAVPVGRHVRMPGSTSFPSGHTASAFAFATAVGGELPWLSFPLHLLATTVAYSRVHTGVHYPLDAVIGAALGAASGGVTTYTLDRLWPPAGTRVSQAT